jgi:undecaprenyl-diphosphatase
MTNIPEGTIWDWDRAAMLALNGDWGAGGDVFWWAISQPWLWIPLYVAALWLMYKQLGWRGMLIAFVFLVVGLALADQTANFFKGHTPKLRPLYTELMWGVEPFNAQLHIPDVDGHRYGSFGTVSGHVATATAIGLIAAGILRRRWFTFAMCGYVVLTAYSRIYLAVHFPLDVIFGFVAGVLIGFLMLWLRRLLFFRRPLEHPQAL